MWSEPQGRLAGKGTTNHESEVQAHGGASRVAGGCLIRARQDRAGTGAEPTGFFAIYERNRRGQVPSYVTEDILVRAYLLTLEAAVTEYEEEHAAPGLRELLSRLRARLGSVTEAERAAQGYLATLEALLAGREAGAADPPGVAAELARVRAAEGLAESPLLRQRLDYSQFRVRGKYTCSAELSRYFQAVRVAGTVLFPLLESRATGVNAEAADTLTGAAWLISRVLADDEWAAALYNRATYPLDYVFGPPDAMTVAQYAGHEVPGAADDGGWRELRRELFAECVRPRVFGSYVDRELLEPGVSVADVLAGWQFLPGRWAPASEAFQEFVHYRVGPWVGPGGKAPFTLGAAGGVAVKALPTAMELGALLGSAMARDWLEHVGDSESAGYEEGFGQAGAAPEPAGLATHHLELLRVWLTGWAGERRLNTALGFWVQQGHGSVAYTKQSYTVGGRSLPAMDGREEACLDPAGQLYRGLARVARLAGSQLRSSRLGEYAALAERCADLAGMALGADDVRFLNELDRSLLEWPGGPDGPVAKDCHTDANSEREVPAAPGSARATREQEWRSPLGIEFVWIPAGRFVMGAPEGEEGRIDNEVQHEVRISRGFWMGKYPVTQGEWTAVMGENPARFEKRGPRCPVESVSWDHAQGFIRKLNRRESGSGYKYRLPTEAEWEYAARAGIAEATPWGDLKISEGHEAPVLAGQAWYRGTRLVLYPGEDHDDPFARSNVDYGTNAVGQKRGNEWGLHDMLGNVWEWTADWYGEYPSGPVTDPRGPSTGLERVVRGGCWASDAEHVRSAARTSGRPDGASQGSGFRLVRTG